MTERFADAFAVTALTVGTLCLVAIAVSGGVRTWLIWDELQETRARRETPQNAYTNPGPYPHETSQVQSQRTWADLFAACRLTDAWLGSDVDGEPACYPMAQEGTP